MSQWSRSIWRAATAGRKGQTRHWKLQALDELDLEPLRNEINSEDRTADAEDSFCFLLHHVPLSAFHGTTKSNNNAMKLFSRRVRHLLLDSLQHAVVVLVVFALAAGLNYAEHLCKKAGVDAVLCFGFRVLSYFAFLTDGVYFIGLCIMVVVSVVKEIRRAINE